MYYVIVDDVDVDVSNFINDDDYMVFFLFILKNVLYPNVGI